MAAGHAVPRRPQATQPRAGAPAVSNPGRHIGPGGAGAPGATTPRPRVVAGEDEGRVGSPRRGGWPPPCRGTRARPAFLLRCGVAALRESTGARESGGEEPTAAAP